jgi:hypothetical protein
MFFSKSPVLNRSLGLKLSISRKVSFTSIVGVQGGDIKQCVKLVESAYITSPCIVLCLYTI